METTIDEFPHHGSHLANDHQQAQVTVALLVLFVGAVFLTLLALLG